MTVTESFEINGVKLTVTGPVTNVDAIIKYSKNLVLGRYNDERIGG